MGMNNEQAEADKDWKCGYCRANPDGDGVRQWKLDLPQGKRKKPKVAKPRKDADTPKARGLDPDVVLMLKVGPKTWQDIINLTTEGRKKIYDAEAAYKKRAAKIVKAGGHHIVDQMGLGGVEARAITNELLDDLYVAGLLDGDDPEDNDDMDVEDDK